MKIMTDFIVSILIYIFILYPRWKKQGYKRLLINTTMYVYLVFVLYFTLMPILFSIPHLFEKLDPQYALGPINFIPFVDILNHRGDFIRQVVLNIIMTIPFGFLLPIVSKKCHLVRTVVITCLFSISIECLQLFSILYRSTDITDVITNTLGGLIGYLLYCLLKTPIDRFYNEKTPR